MLRLHRAGCLETARLTISSCQYLEKRWCGHRVQLFLPTEEQLQGLSGLTPETLWSRDLWSVSSRPPSGRLQAALSPAQWRSGKGLSEGRQVGLWERVSEPWRGKWHGEYRIPPIKAAGGSPGQFAREVYGEGCIRAGIHRFSGFN